MLGNQTTLKIDGAGVIAKPWPIGEELPGVFSFFFAQRGRCFAGAFDCGSSRSPRDEMHQVVFDQVAVPASSRLNGASACDKSIAVGPTN